MLLRQALQENWVNFQRISWALPPSLFWIIQWPSEQWRAIWGWLFSMCFYCMPYDLVNVKYHEVESKINPPSSPIREVNVNLKICHISNGFISGVDVWPGCWAAICDMCIPYQSAWIHVPTLLRIHLTLVLSELVHLGIESVVMRCCSFSPQLFSWLDSLGRHLFCCHLVMRIHLCWILKLFSGYY